MNYRWSRHLSLFFSAGLALSAYGCGDDDGGGDRPDARPTADAAGGNPDAAVTGLLRSGTIAVTESAIANDIPGSPWSGAVVRIGFSDATTGSAPAPVAGFDSVINNCLIQVWDVGTNSPSDPADEGAVGVTGTSNGDFACGFASPTLGYVCQSTDAAIAGGDATGFTLAGNGTAGTLTFVGAPAAAEMKGMYIVLTGFAPIPDGTRFPVIAFAANGAEPDSLTLAGVPNTGGVLTGDLDATFANYVGVAPVPAGGAQFLDDGDALINVSKAAGDVVAVIDEDFHAQGQGFTLLDDAGSMQYTPADLPFDGSEVNFVCDGADCGAVGTGGLISAIVINGETTDAAVGAITSPADAMPAPETQYATFTCAYIVSDTPGTKTATLSADMMAAILGTSPTRIQTSVGRYRGAILEADDGTYSVNVLQGHSILGWSDAE